MINTCIHRFIDTQIHIHIHAYIMYAYIHRDIDLIQVE